MQQFVDFVLIYWVGYSMRQIILFISAQLYFILRMHISRGNPMTLCSLGTVCLISQENLHYINNVSYCILLSMLQHELRALFSDAGTVRDVHIAGQRHGIDPKIHSKTYGYGELDRQKVIAYFHLYSIYEGDHDIT